MNSISVQQDRDLALVTNSVLNSFNQKKRAVIADGMELLDLSMINPDLSPPRMLVDKLVEASVRPALHRYAVARGIGRLRAAFQEKYRESFGVVLDPETEICVTFGSKDAILHALMCFDRERRNRGVLLGLPLYPAHAAALQLLGYNTTYFEISNNESQMLEGIEAACNSNDIGCILLNFPHNPTGISVTKEFWSHLVALAKKNDIFLLNDFVYGELVFDQTAAPSLLGVDTDFSNSAEVYSLSKAYSIPGWRVGALLGNPHLTTALSALKSQVDYGLFLPLQHAAAEALLSTDGLARKACERYLQRARVLTDGLRSSGWQVRMPAAGCCVWGTMPDDYPVSAEEFALLLLDREGIAVLPGNAFGGDFTREIRFALVQDEERMRLVVNAIRRVVDEFKSKN